MTVNSGVFGPVGLFYIQGKWKDNIKVSVLQFLGFSSSYLSIGPECMVIRGWDELNPGPNTESRD